MITKMTKYTLACSSSYSEELLKALQQTGVIDITRSTRPIDRHSSQLMQQALELKDEMAGTALKRDLAACRGRIAALEKELAAAAAWGEYSEKALTDLEAAGCTVCFHSLAKKKFEQAWTEQMPLEVIGEVDGKVLFVTLCRSGEDPSASSLGIGGQIDRPRTQSAVQQDIAVASTERFALEEAIAGLPAKNVGLQKEYDALMVELDMYLAAKGSVTEGELEGYADIFEAYAPTEDDAALRSVLDQLPIYYNSEQATEDSTPIKLRNNWFTRQFEVFTGMYGMPLYGEFDPTPILGPFFLLFFSMCMGDAGYGLLLIAISQILRVKMPQSGLGKMHSLIMLLGIGTFVVGIFLGTFFGISLFYEDWVPMWLKKLMIVEGNVGKIAGFDPQIMLALGIGIFHICLAMVVKTACATARNGFRASAGVWGWTLLVVGGVVTAALAIAGLLGGNALRWSVIALGAISFLGIFPFNTVGRNPLLNVGAGLWDSYNMITGLLGDTLSYIRLYALGLAGGMLGGVFNNLATMLLGDNPGWQWVPFVLIVVLGHALNLAMSCLGAFVHPLRLSFVEYFKNSGYEGRGVKYRPLTENNNNQ